MRRARRENIEANRPGGRVLAGSKPGQSSRTGSDRGHGQGGMDSPCPPRPPTQVEEKAGHVKGFVDQMLHDFKIANQERDGLQKRLEEAEKRLKDMEALHAKIGMLEKEKEEMAERVQFIQRPDLYELLTDKLRGHTDPRSSLCHCQLGERQSDLHKEEHHFSRGHRQIRSEHGRLSGAEARIGTKQRLDQIQDRLFCLR